MMMVHRLCIYVMDKQHLRPCDSLLSERGWLIVVSWLTGQCFSWKVCHYVEVIGSLFMAEHKVVKVLKINKTAIDFTMTILIVIAVIRTRRGYPPCRGGVRSHDMKMSPTIQAGSVWPNEN